MRATLHLLFVTLAALLPIAAAGQDTVDPAKCHAYGANIGWINARPGITRGLTLTDTTLDGWAYAGNVGWIQFGDGSPTNGVRYRNDSATDCGVNHDGAGNLSGYAYGANIGWIHFGWATANHPQRPRVNLLSGAFEGHAYGANVGWINLGGGILRTTRIFTADADGDGISDAWERQHFGNITKAGTSSDSDNDGQSDAAEYLAATNPASSLELFQVLGQGIEVGANRATLSFRSSSSRLYRIEHSATLKGQWQDSALGLFTPDPGGVTTRVITFPPGGARFFRVVSVRPLNP